uniref:PTS sugar transporter subunit IIA n=1 Tax=Aeromonas veronii TaxID=654 RepID=UPI0013E95FCB
LMNPRLILAVIAGGMTGVFTLTLFNAGLVSPASPGSIFAVLLMTPKASLIGVALSIISATLVSFLVAAVFVRAQQPEADEADALGEATRKMKAMKGGKPETAAAKKPGGELMAVRNIVVACDAGMGSSAMGAGLLRKRVQAAGLDISVTNRAIDQLDDQVDWVITHKDLTERARRHAPNAHHISLTNFLDNGLYQELVQSLSRAANDDVANPQLLVAANDDSYEPQTAEVFTLSRHDVHLGLKADSKEAAILTAGRLLAERGYVAPDYVNAMLEREQLVSTYLGESIAVPHGTIAAKEFVKRTGIVICQYPAGVAFGEAADEVARLVIGIAARNDEHMQVITRLTNALDEPGLIDRLASTTDPQAFLDLLGAEQAA